MGLEEYQTAKAALMKGASLDKKDSRFITFIKKCDDLTAEESKPITIQEKSPISDVELENDLSKQVAEPAAKPKYRHEFYQKPDEVVVTIFAKGIPQEKVTVDFGEQILSVRFGLPGEDEYNFQPRLFGKIIPTRSRYEVLSTKIEIFLAKAEPLHWTCLEYTGQVLVQRKVPASSGHRPTYPSSKPTRVDLDKLEVQVKKEEKEEKLDGDAALNKFFHEIYQDTDGDPIRAMRKSFKRSPEVEKRRMVGGNNINSVFYASSYHPIQAGSIDGTDILPHDNAVYRALLCSSAGLYDPFGDPKATGDPYCTVFIGRLSHTTTEETLHKAMGKYGRVKKLRLVRDIVTGASRGYAFVEYETESEMQRAYEDAHHSFIDDCEILVDFNRQQLMPGWIPRRLGGGLGGKKESGQLRFGGRERPFRAPLRPIPYKDLERLGIPPPPEGRYMSRFQIPSPPRRERSNRDKESSSRRRSSNDRIEGSGMHYKSSSSHRDDDHTHRRRSTERREERDGDYYSRRRSYAEKERHSRQEHRRKMEDRDEHTESRQKHDRKRKDRDEH